jgi:DNA-binding transcriptional LysR family regulator
MSPDLGDMALFVEVAKVMSFRGAAAAIGVPNSTLSRRISALEKAIGLRLLHRTTRRIELTEAGRIYFERCKRIVDEARLAHEQLGDMLAQPSGVLRASLPVGFAYAFLAPLVAEFASRYPAITFELDLSHRRADLITEPVDVAIRMGESTDSSLISRQITQLPRHLYAAPRYIEGAGELSQPRDLAAHDCLRLRSGQTDMWTLLRSRESVTVPVQGRFLLNDVGMIQRLAILGCGIAMLAEAVAAEDVAHGRLRRVLPRWQAPPIAVYAITETKLLPAKTQLFIDFLRASLRIGPASAGFSGTPASSR